MEEEWKTVLEKTYQCTQPGSNPNLPLFGSLVQHESNALDHAATKAESAQFVRQTLPEGGVKQRGAQKIYNPYATTTSKKVTQSARGPNVRPGRRPNKRRRQTLGLQQDRQRCRREIRDEFLSLKLALF
uniref:Uncharacterized protein n=1 Tax=Timema poppense TaxID=170557 RepID=A0A7R9GTQ4_TIMPO|nr:unnamed protein product [Timema poppensis]